jgi:hypothetical protein
VCDLSPHQGWIDLDVPTHFHSFSLFNVDIVRSNLLQSREAHIHAAQRIYCPSLPVGVSQGSVGALVLEQLPWIVETHQMEMCGMTWETWYPSKIAKQSMENTAKGGAKLLKLHRVSKYI